MSDERVEHVTLPCTCDPADHGHNYDPGCVECGCDSEPVPADESEVREEWGVRYDVISGGVWREGYVSAAENREDAEWKRDEEIPRRPRIWRNPTLVRRIVTTTPWEVAE